MKKFENFKANIPFLKNWDVIDIVELKDEISKNTNIDIETEWEYFSSNNRNDLGYLHWIDDDVNMKEFDSYLKDEYGYKPKEQLIFYLSI